MISKIKYEKMLFWSPRILGILYVIFISIFALDVFSEDYKFPEIIWVLLIHLLPSLIFAILLIIAWKKEFIGAITFLTLSIVFTIFFNSYENIISFLIISLPVLIMSFGFFANYKFSKVKKE